MADAPGETDRTLTTVPRELLQKILGFCDYPAIACLRKTCKSLRHFLDNPSWQCFVSSIHVLQRVDHAILKLRTARSAELISFEYRSAEGPQAPFEYDLQECYRIIQRPTHFMHPFFNDLGLLLEHTETSVLDEFYIEFDNLDLMISTTYEETCLRVFSERLQGYLTRDELVKTTSLTLRIGMVQESLNFLPFFDATSLKTLKLVPAEQIEFMGLGRHVMHVNHLVPMEQWRRAENLVVEDIEIHGPVVNYFHFKKIDILTPRMEIWDVETMIRALIARGDMETHFVVRTFLDDWRGRIGFYGEAFENKFYFCLPGVDRILVWLREMRKIDLKFINRVDVPDQVRIINMNELPPRDRIFHRDF